MVATLNDIRVKVRRLVKAPSSNQITDAQIDDYINTFYLYDFPEHLRQFSLKDTVNITLLPNIDVYSLPVGTPVNVPITSIGNSTGLTTSFDLYSLLGLPTNSTIVPGTVVAQVLTATLSAFSDSSTTSTYTGNLNAVSGNASGGFINYQTGNLTLNFNTAIAATATQITFNYSAPEYLTVNPPVYIAGYESYYTQSRGEFYRMYPPIHTFNTLSTGNGGAGPYTGTTTGTPILRGSVLISATSTAGNSLTLQDDSAGNLFGNGTGTINYTTGAVSVTFSTTVTSGTAIKIQYVPYTASRPQAVLYFNDQITVRPVPDQAYVLNIEVFKRPTALFASGSQPLLTEWWQCIAVGASIKIFEDRGDFEQLNQYVPLLNHYLALCQRRTLVQIANERTATIYSEQSFAPSGSYYGVF